MTEANRDTLVQLVTDFLSVKSLDGVDFHWDMCR